MSRPLTAAALLLAWVLLGGCSSRPNAAAPAGPLAATGFEDLDGWLPPTPARATLTRARAHAGRYSTLVGPGHEFSLGYSNTLSQLAPAAWPGRLRVSAWVLVPGPRAAAQLVTEVKGAGSQGARLLWKGLDLATVVKAPNRWQHVEQIVALPAAATANSRLLVYLWRASSPEPVYLDDLQISLAHQSPGGYLTTSTGRRRRTGQSW